MRSHESIENTKHVVSNYHSELERERISTREALHESFDSSKQKEVMTGLQLCR